MHAASASLVERNRQNAQHSTGPRTPEGKSRVRLNACKHNLSGQTVLMPDDDRDAYEALGRQLLADFAPKTEQELRQVHILQDTKWRLDRISSTEANLLALGLMECEPKVPAHVTDPAMRKSFAQAIAYRENAKLLDQLSRHELRWRRQYTQTLTSLAQLLRQRAERERKAAASAAPAKPAAAIERPTGFVLHANAQTLGPAFMEPDLNAPSASHPPEPQS